MQTLALIVFAIGLICLVIVAAIRPRRSGLSLYELERRDKNGNTAAADEMRRELMLADMMSIYRIVAALLLVSVTLAACVTFGLPVGAVIALAVAMFFGKVSQLDIVRRIGKSVEVRLEPSIMQFIDRNASLVKLIRNSDGPSLASRQVASREELEYLIAHSTGIMTESEKKFIKSALHFDERRVDSIMTPRGVIAGIKKDEVLGPLTLHDLHKTGHTRFPVIDGDIDHIVGILHIQDLLVLKDKASHTAEALMEPKVYYITEDKSLAYALAAFLRTRHHLFIVINDYRETSGLLTLEDTMEALLGRRIIDENDFEPDLRRAAEIKAQTNNHPPDAVDV